MNWFHSNIHKPLYTIILLVFLIIISYVQVLWVGWYFDDYHVVIGSSLLNSPQAVSEIISTFIQRGVVNLSYLFDLYFTNSIFGIENIGEFDQYPAILFHVINVIYHLLASILLYFFLRILNQHIPFYQQSFTPVCISILFAVSRLNSESVIYVSGRASVVMTLFYLLGLILFIKMLETNSFVSDVKHKIVGCILLLLLTGVTFAGISSKFSFLSFPLMMGVLLFYKYSHHSFRSKLMYVGGSFGLLLLFVVGIVIYRSIGLQQPFFEKLSAFPNWLDGVIAFILNSREAQVRSPLSNFITQFSNLHLYYLPRALGMFPLNFDPYIETIQILDYRSFLIFTSLVFIAVCLRKSTPLFLFGIVWYWITFLPSSSIIPLNDLVGERRAYLPNIGLSIAFVSLFTEYVYGKIGTRYPKYRSFVLILLIGFMTFHVFSTHSRVYLFTDKIELWKQTAEHSEKHPRPFLHLASAYWKNEQYKEATEAYHKALKLNPNMENAAMNLGIIYMVHLKEYQKAEFIFQNCIRMWKDNMAHWSNLGNNYLLSKNYSKAEAFAKAWLNEYPNQYDAKLLLANINYMQNKLKPAKQMYLELVKKKRNKSVFTNLSIIEQKQGNDEQARHWKSQADQIQSQSKNFETDFTTRAVELN